MKKSYNLEQFDFNKTIVMLQRGSFDPINIIENGEWRRCFYENDSISLISTSYNNGINFTVLQGSMSDKKAQAMIEYTLGFDDPFLTTHIHGLPYKDKLKSTIGLNIPGYPDLFEAIIQIIMGQQISVAVANKVRAKFTIQFGDNINYMDNAHCQLSCDNFSIFFVSSC